MAETSIPFKPCIIVHGGAGNIPISRREQVLCAVKEAVKIGYHVLLEVRFLKYFTRLFTPIKFAYGFLSSKVISLIMCSFQRCLSLVFMCGLYFILTDLVGS